MDLLLAEFLTLNYNPFWLQPLWNGLFLPWYAIFPWGTTHDWRWPCNKRPWWFPRWTSPQLTHYQRAVVRCRVNLENHWAGRQGMGGSMPDSRMLWQVDTCWQGRQGWVQLGKLSIKSFQSRARVIRKHPFSSQRFTAIFRQDLPVLLQKTLVDDFFIEKAEVILWCGAGMKNNSAYGSSFFTRVRDSKWQLEEQMPAL